MSEENDPYLIPHTDVLKNKLGITDQEELNKEETDKTSARMLRLYFKPPTITGSFKDIQNIHYQLFQDVYLWAGKVRTANISKGDTIFLPTHFFSTAIPYFEDTLRNLNYLQDSSREEFVEGCTELFNQLNIIHPFREGNGRVSRFYFQCLAAMAGYRINWEDISEEENITASKLGVLKNDSSLIFSMLDKSVVSIDDSGNREQSNLFTKSPQLDLTQDHYFDFEI